MKNSSLILFVIFLSSLILSCNRFSATEESALESARLHYNKGMEMLEKDSVVDALKEFFYAKEIMENGFNVNKFLADETKFMALIYTRIAEIFHSYGIGRASLYAYKNALSYFQKIDDYDLSNIYRFIGNSYYFENVKDSALYYYRTAIKMSENRDNEPVYLRAISEAAPLYYDVGYKDTAFMLIREAMLSPENEDMYLGHCATIGSLFFYECQYDSAIFYFKKSINRDYYPTKVFSAEYLMECYDVLGDATMMEYYQTVFGNYFKQYREASEIVSELSNIYESYKLEKSLDEHQKNIRKQNRNVIFLSIQIFVFIITIIVFVKMMTDKRNDIAKMKRKMDANTFITEPICKYILDVVHANQFKSKVGFEIYKEFALDKNQLMMLRDAVDRHHDNFTQKLIQRFPELKSDDIDYCCLYLLGLKDADVSALMQRAYPTVCERSRKLKRIFNSNEPLPITLKNIIETINQ